MIRWICLTLAAILTLFALTAASVWPSLLWANHCAGLACLTCLMALTAFLMLRHE